MDNGNFVMRVGVPGAADMMIADCAQRLSTLYAAGTPPCRHRGFAVDVLAAALHIAGIDNVVVPLDGDDYGVDENTNGAHHIGCVLIVSQSSIVRADTYSGYLGAVQRGVVDTVAADFWHTAKRARIFNFTPPYYTDRQAVLVPEHAASTPSLWRALPLVARTFSLGVWTVLIALVAISYALPRVVPRERVRRTIVLASLLYGAVGALAAHLYETMLLASLIVPHTAVGVVDFDSLVEHLARGDVSLVVPNNHSSGVLPLRQQLRAVNKSVHRSLSSSWTRRRTVASS